MTHRGRDFGLLATRLCMSAVFLFSGFSKAQNPGSAVDEFAGMGLPLPMVALTLTVAIQVLGGLALVAGRCVQLASLTLAGFTILATVVGHTFWRASGFDFDRELTTALEHLAIVGGLILLALTGPGSLILRKTSRAKPSD